MPDRYPAMEDHAVIGDLHTVALVATDGTIDWCCLPRFDSPAVFGSLLDTDRGGSFAVWCEAARTRQLYMPDSNVLVTRFLGTDWVGEVIDFMVPRQDGGPLAHPRHLLVRRLRAVRGTVGFKINCRPAFDFGRQDHVVHAPDHSGAVFTCPGAHAELVLRAGQRFSVAGPAARAELTLGPGEGLDLLAGVGRPAAAAEVPPRQSRTSQGAAVVLTGLWPTTSPRPRPAPRRTARHRPRSHPAPRRRTTPGSRLTSPDVRTPA